MAETQITTGTFKTTSATPLFLPIPNYINRFTLRNLTRSGITALGVTGVLTSDRIVEAYYAPGYTTDTALIRQNGTAAAGLAPLNNGIVAQNGFTVINGASYQQGPSIAIASFVPSATASTQATVFTTGAAHGFKVGDNVRIVGMTTAPEIGGLVMTVTAVGGGGLTFTTMLNTFASVTSVGSVYKVGNAYIQNSSLYFPQNRVVAGITQANPMVVTTLVPQNYAIGDVVRFQIPTVFGMQQIVSGSNGLPLEFTVRAVNNAVGTQTVTLEADSTAYTAFAWAAAASYPYSLPMMVPQGEGNTNNLSGIVPFPLPYANQNVLSFARQNTALNGILIGAGTGAVADAATDGIIGSGTDAWAWEAYTSQQDFPNVPIY